MPARVFSRVLAEDSGQLTAAEIAERLDVSPAAVSGAVNYLTRVGMLVRTREPGTRRDLFRVHEDGWGEMYTQQAALLRRWIEAADEGATALGRRHAGRPRARRDARLLRLHARRAAGAHPALARPRLSTRSSPRRSVTCSASRCSRYACAYLREVPSSSRSARQRDRAVALDHRDEPRPDGGERLRMDVHRRAEPHGTAVSAQGVERRSASSSASSGGSAPAARSSLLDRQRRGVESAAGGVGRGLRLRGRRRARRAPRRARARASRASRSRDGPCRRGAASSTTPPPSVSGGASERITSRSPRSGTIGCSSRSWKNRPPSSTSRAADSRVPWWTRDPRAAVRPRVGRGPRERARRRGTWARASSPADDHVAARRPRPAPARPG